MDQKPVLENRRSLWWLVVVLVAALGLGAWAWLGKDQANSNGNASTVNTNIAATNVNAKVTYWYPGKDGKNALRLLKDAYPNTTTKSSSLGDYVTSINGQAASSSEYWQFFVNGKSSDVGPSKYITKSTDLIEWKLTSL